MLSRVALVALSSMRAMSADVRPSGIVTIAGLSLLGGLALGSLAAVTPAHAQQGGPDDLYYRVERLEHEIREMTGQIEQLQYRNQQLEAALNEMRNQGGPRVAAAPPPAMAQPVQPGAPVMSGGVGGRRGDAFDPAASPYAPGAPRQLGTLSPQPPPPNTRPGMGPTPYAGGASGGADQGYGRPPGGVDQGYGQPAGAANSYPVATAAPPPPQQQAGSPREVYDAGLAYLKRRDYASAEQAFRDFLTRFPSDRLASEAQFNLGESLYQGQNYREAADAFLQLSKNYENSPKAPDAMLRLGQSLAAMNEKDLACTAFADVSKYPRASSSVKQAIEREQKRARC